MAVSGFAVDADSGGCRCDVEVCSKTAFPGGHPEELLDDHNHVLHSVGVFGGGVFYSLDTSEYGRKAWRCWNLYDTVDCSTKSDQLLTIYSAGIDKAHYT
jgi:hypothetical protein